MFKTSEARSTLGLKNALKDEMMTLVSPRQNLAVTPSLVKETIQTLTPLELVWFPPHTTYNPKHPDQIFNLLYAEVHPIRDYGHPGNLIPPTLTPEKLGCTSLTLDRT